MINIKSIIGAILVGVGGVIIGVVCKEPLTDFASRFGKGVNNFKDAFKK